MKLTGYEMETIILYNQAEPNAARSGTGESVRGL